ncbi:Gfo/Idh/MocA family oxidoreductase [Pseudarthrobacter sulfonivorans]|uniref:Gfo/Idh/MocA family protein n=1 Tax=Pseudarthrobacter sulfonivorans TaxID=121292 RepID=UPI00286AE673|nr:Gfo/Idh/MocA family oxidoreductase [Pseudarthrobacter sulfonivorans]
MLRLAQLGTWHLHAAHHVEAARRNRHTEVVLVWDERRAAGRAFAAEHALDFEHDLDVILARTDIDGVIIDTATSDHPDVIAAAARAGKHVFTEKVLTIRTDDAVSLINLAANNGVVLAVSLQRLIEAPIRTVKRLLDEGAVGKITASRIRYEHHGAVGVPWIPEHFFDKKQTGGGALIDLGAHPIYLAMLIHGCAPDAVTARMSYVTDREIEDNAVAVMDFPGGAFSVAEVSMVASFFAYSLEVTGTAGTIAIGPSDGRVLLRQGAAGEWVEQEPSPALADPFDQWVNAVMTGAVDPGHLTTALRVTQIIEAAYKSAESGRTVALEALSATPA